MKKRYMVVGLLVLLLAVASLATACGSDEATTTTAAPSTETTTASSTDSSASTDTTTAAGPATGEPILVGLDNSLIGAYATPGKSIHQGVAVQVAYINANGGINGRPLEIIEYDDQSDVTNAIANLNKLIDEDKVFATVGPFPQAFQQTAREIAEQKQVIMVGNGPATLAELAPDAKKYTWSVYVPSSPTAQAEGFSKIIKMNGWTNILAAGDVLPIHQETLDELAGLGSTESFTLTKMADTVTMDQTDYQPMLNKLMDQINQVNPDAIILDMWGGAVAPLCKGLRALGVTVPIQAGTASAHPMIFMEGTEAVEGLLVMDSGGNANSAALPDDWPLKANQLAFQERYQEMWGEAPDFTAACGADLVTVLAEALKNAGGADDKEKVRQALMSITDLQLLEGFISFTPDDNTIGVKDYMVEWQLKDGQFTFVSTVD